MEEPPRIASGGEGVYWKTISAKPIASRRVSALIPASLGDNASGNAKETRSSLDASAVGGMGSVTSRIELDASYTYVTASPPAMLTINRWRRPAGRNALVTSLI